MTCQWVDEKCARSNAILCERKQAWSIDKLQAMLLDTKTSVENTRVEMSAYQSKLESQQGEIKALLSQINYLKQNPVPCGFIYVQTPGQSEPKKLWPNTEWESVTEKYAGLFFRAEGGQSAPFGRKQEQQTHTLELKA